MQRLGLDRVWWLVTPGNPLKDTRGLASLATRVAAARALAHHPRIDVTDLEAKLGTTLHLRDDPLSGPAVRRRAFRLDHGRRQFAQLPSLAALARHRRDGAHSGGRSPRSKPLCTGSAAGHWLSRFRLPESAARTLAERKPPAWIYLHGLKSPLSSTALRAARALQES